ncbi:MAG: flagellar biosynthesis chaperone [Bacillota bacterium]|jgi:flagellar FliJ protein|nr:flagellar biosynthesis chaperone [Bacillota bacterium]
MKKFSFSLQKILEIKQQILDNFKYELSNLNHQLISLDMDIKNLNNKYISMDEEFNKKSSVCITVGEITYYKMLMGSILKKVENKQEDKKIISKKILEKRIEIISVNKEISSLEKLRDKELEKYNALVTKNEEIFIEEFISSKSIQQQFVF